MGELGEQQYPCRKCDYVSTLTRNLKKHTVCNHEGVKYIYTCFATTTTTDLNQHIESKQSKISLWLLCDYSATLISSLKKHIESKQSKISLWLLCDYSATLISSKKKHIESKHDRVKYPCDYSVITMWLLCNTYK